MFSCGKYVQLIQIIVKKMTGGMSTDGLCFLHPSVIHTHPGGKLQR